MLYGYKNLLNKFVVFVDDEHKNGKIISCWTYGDNIMLLLMDHQGQTYVKNVTKVKIVGTSNFFDIHK